jgi:hypothetical protein
MATGSGKTRTVIALVKQSMEAGWVKRVLFLADRTALVTQGANAFKAHLPDATTVNLVTEKITDGRVYVCTYPTMMNLINDTDSGLRKFGPGYFDLVVIDEAHRSVYQKYRAIFEWFDSLLVGLTATPKDEVDHNTYRLFHLEDGVPTDVYGLDDAVKEGFLVPARAFRRHAERSSGGDVGLCISRIATMAPSGRRPKPDGHAVTWHLRAYGWIDVDPSPFDGDRALPPYPRDGSPWPCWVKTRWDAWQSMPHARLWQESDWQFAFDAIELASRVFEPTSVARLDHYRSL